MASHVPPFLVFLCIGLSILRLEGGPIRRQAQLQNVQSPPVINQNQGADQAQLGMQNGFGPGDPNQLNNFQSNGQSTPSFGGAAGGGGGGGMDALINILQQVLMQQQQNGQSGLSMGPSQPGQPMDQSSGQLLALLGNAAMRAGPSAAPPPLPSNMGDMGAQSLPPSLVPNFPQLQNDPSIGNGSIGQQNPVVGNVPVPSQGPLNGAGATNASSQFMGMLGK